MSEKEKNLPMFSSLVDGCAKVMPGLLFFKFQGYHFPVIFRVIRQGEGKGVILVNRS